MVKISKQFEIESQEIMTNSWIKDYRAYLEMLSEMYHSSHFDGISKIQEFDKHAEIGDSVSLREVRLENSLNKYFLVMLFTFVETRLTNICDLLNDGNHGVFDMNAEYGHTGIDKVKNYIRRQIDQRAVNNEVPWNEIQELRIVRNFIVHEGGRLRVNPYKSSSLTRIVNNNTYLTLEGNDLYVEQEYCKKTVERVQKFFSPLYAIIHAHFLKIEGKRHPADEMSFDEYMSTRMGLPIMSAMGDTIETKEDLDRLMKYTSELFGDPIDLDDIFPDGYDDMPPNNE